ncbi:uncharacterized protein MELLADRAFT_113776 [Melampsora larici-populina 98AG31]|uniref:Uncharacterized protein n=1 Tax=Melampsora larici-populina (strain 98AG31 / pathotype 3-4-7) TaxID=747676 RepID=F4SB10_MELLP|nr:uncharacterized protein MELLADRAFT_113776 [Melampsora larici-populina 98AG31]EGF98168.1 hypothetical protein MELLADRAFT_113776 [Melampsora larici-populina 98AG31]
MKGVCDRMGSGGWTGEDWRLSALDPPAVHICASAVPCAAGPALSEGENNGADGSMAVKASEASTSTSVSRTKRKQATPAVRKNCRTKKLTSAELALDDLEVSQDFSLVTFSIRPALDLQIQIQALISQFEYLQLNIFNQISQALIAQFKYLHLTVSSSYLQALIFKLLSSIQMSSSSYRSSTYHQFKSISV